MVIGVIFKQRTVQRVRSALCLEVNGGSAGKSLLGGEAVGDNVDLLDRFEGRDVGDHVRKKNVVSTHAVNTSVVLVVAGPVDVELQRTGRVGRDRVGIERRREAGQGSINLLVVPTQRHGKILQFISGEIGVHLRSVCLKDR